MAPTMQSAEQPPTNMTQIKPTAQATQNNCKERKLRNARLILRTLSCGVSISALVAWGANWSAYSRSYDFTSDMNILAILAPTLSIFINVCVSAIMIFLPKSTTYTFAPCLSFDILSLIIFAAALARTYWPDDQALMVPWGLTLGAGVFQAIASCIDCHVVRKRRSDAQTDEILERPELEAASARSGGFSAAELSARISEDSFDDPKSEFSVQELDGKMSFSEDETEYGAGKV